MGDIVKIARETKSNVSLASILCQLMNSTNTNVNQLCKNTGLAHTTIKRMCSDPDCNPTLFSIEKVASFFGITPNQLIGITPLNQEESSYLPNVVCWDRVPILKYSQVVEWPKNLESVRESADTQYVMTDISVGETVFAISAQDESLEPKFCNGTILIFDPLKPVNNKDYILFIQNGKLLPQIRQALIDGPDTYAKSINPIFQNDTPVLLDKTQVRIMGVLIQAKSNYY